MIKGHRSLRGKNQSSEPNSAFNCEKLRVEEKVPLRGPCQRSNSGKGVVLDHSNHQEGQGPEFAVLWVYDFLLPSFMETLLNTKLINNIHMGQWRLSTVII